ncbi:DUF58 domain-containing protein [Amycolatopsis ultiminotia]|uniref:DUF58 domain-containing protein n=1 Tax=Amycolatopsis ultiminotia TaxID=543629 RepID=A0ABP6XIE6_9PSEU
MSTVAVRWQPTRLALALATCAGITVLAGAILGKIELLGFAAPLLGALAGGRQRQRPAGSLTVETRLQHPRCLEYDEVPLTVDAGANGPVDEISVSLPSPHVETSTRDGRTFMLRPGRWGRWSLQPRVAAYAHSGLAETTLTAERTELRVYPAAGTLAAMPRPADLPDRAGVHIGRRRGSGIEFAAVRPYQPGDLLRRINWTASARRGQLHVTDRLAEQAAEIVAVVDSFSDVPQPGGSTLDLGVHGATSVVQTALDRGDRAGVVALGGILRWVGPDVGERQFYRVADTLLEVRLDDAVVEPDLGRIPRPALPPRAAVVMFSPLLDRRALASVRDLRQRGCALVVVDTLRTAPPTGRDSRIDRIALRLWRLERRRVEANLTDLGIPVVRWPVGHLLDEVLGPLARRPLPGRTG